LLERVERRTESGAYRSATVSGSRVPRAAFHLSKSAAMSVSVALVHF
jgi:hypothetical protein